MSTATVRSTLVPKYVVTRRAAGAAATGFLAMAGFQAALALGAPLGHAAWGGADSVLPAELRTASAAAAAILVFAALMVLRRAGYRIPNVSLRLSRWGTWLLGGAMGLSALANFASSSTWERVLMGPVALLLGLLCVAVARTASRTDQPD